MKLQNPCVFSRSTDIKPTIKPKPGRPLCYEQMSKFRVDWWVSGTDVGGHYLELGPYSRAEALKVAGRPPE